MLAAPGGAIDDGESLEENAIPLALRAGSLVYLRALCLEHCCLKVDDLRNIISACPSLKSFRYFGGTTNQGPYNLTPAQIIELLEPLKGNLEILSIELEREDYDSGVAIYENYLLGSLAHMSALRQLETSADMWIHVEANDLGAAGYDFSVDSPLPNDGTRLCYRLPPSIQTLIFHLNEVDTEPALSQISDLVKMRPDVLPNLQKLYIATEDTSYADEFNQMLVDKSARNTANHSPFDAGVGARILSTVFGTVHAFHLQPDVKWFGDKSSKRWRKPNRVDLALDKTSDAYEDERIGESISDVLANEPELEAALVQKGLNEAAKYYDTDEEETYGNMIHRDTYRH